MLSLIIAAAGLATSAYGFPNGAPLASCGTFTLGSGIYIPNPPAAYAADHYSLHYGTPNATVSNVIFVPNTQFLPDGRGYSNKTTEKLMVLSGGVPISSYVPGTVYNVSVIAAKSFHGLLVGANALSGGGGGDVGIIPGYSINGTYFNQTMGQFQILPCPHSNYVTHNGLSGVVLKPGSNTSYGGIDINFNSATPPSSYGFMVSWKAPAAGTGPIYIGASIAYSWNPRLANGVQAPGAVFQSLVLNENVATTTPTTTTSTTTPTTTTTTTTTPTTTTSSTTTTTSATTSPASTTTTTTTPTTSSTSTTTTTSSTKTTASSTSTTTTTPTTTTTTATTPTTTTTGSSSVTPPTKSTTQYNPTQPTQMSGGGGSDQQVNSAASSSSVGLSPAGLFFALVAAFLVGVIVATVVISDHRRASSSPDQARV